MHSTMFRLQLAVPLSVGSSCAIRVCSVSISFNVACVLAVLTFTDASCVTSLTEIGLFCLPCVLTCVNCRPLTVDRQTEVPVATACVSREKAAQFIAQHLAVIVRSAVKKLCMIAATMHLCPLSLDETTSKRLPSYKSINIVRPFLSCLLGG